MGQAGDPEVREVDPERGQQHGDHDQSAVSAPGGVLAAGESPVTALHLSPTSAS